MCSRMSRSDTKPRARNTMMTGISCFMYGKMEIIRWPIALLRALWNTSQLNACTRGLFSARQLHFCPTMDQCCHCLVFMYLLNDTQKKAARKIGQIVMPRSFRKANKMWSVKLKTQNVHIYLVTLVKSPTVTLLYRSHICVASSTWQNYFNRRDFVPHGISRKF